MEVLASVKYDRKADIGGTAGKNSQVYLAFDHYLNTELVVKEVPKARIPDPSLYFAEAQAVQKAQHPHCVFRPS
jgi:eukaryotic-like serine/threonine-protein kinase